MRGSVLVSVIIPNLNSAMIDRTLAALRAQEFDLSQVEVLVVGRDEPGLVGQDRLVRLIDMGRPRSAAANRNAGIAAARGEVFCFTDSDCIPAPDWLAKLTAPLLRGEAQVVGGGVAFPAGDYWQLVYNLSMFHEFMPHLPPSTRPFLPTLNLAIHSNVVQAVGGMDEQLVRGQDVDWTIRMALAGHVLNFEPEAIISHHPERYDFATVWRYWQRTGYYNIQNRLRYGAYLHTPGLMRSPVALRLLAPFIAAYATVRLFAGSARLMCYLRTMPAIYLTKFAWCLGAAQALCERRPVHASSFGKPS